MKRFNIFIILILAAVCAQAAVTFTLDRPRNAVVGRRFALQFRLVSDNPDDINAATDLNPQRLEIKGMDFYSGPETTSGNSFSYDSRTGQSQSYFLIITYNYIARTAGTTTIPSLSLKVKGRTYKTKPYTIEVLPDNRLTPHGGQSSAPGIERRRQGRVVGSSVGTTTAKDLMVIITFSRNTVYEMEPVVASIKLCLKYDRRFGIDGKFNSVKLPVFDGFLAEDLPVSSNTQLERIGGENYETLELRRYLLYPQKSGHLSVSSGEYELNIVEYEYHTLTGGFARPVEVPRVMKTSTNTASLNVKPLPEPRPAGFSGAVGKFTVSAAIEPEIIRSNESANYILTVKGTGNIKYLTAPEITLPASFEKYTAKTDIDASFSGNNYSGTFRATYPFVPQSVGKVTVDPQPFIYFDPSTGKYVTADTRSFDLNVLRGNAAAVGAQKAIDTQMTDILHIRPLPADVHAASGPVARRAVYWLAYLVVFLALVTVIIVYRSHVRRSADVAGRRLARAGRVAGKRFKVARTFLKAHKPQEFHDELARALKGYVGDKLGIQSSQLITDTIVEKLRGAGVSEDVANEVIAVLNECEMARFTPSGSEQAMTDIYDRAEAAVKSIENVKITKAK